MSEKPCTRCTISKPLEQFYRDNRASDGRMSACKVCYSTDYNDTKKKSFMYKNMHRKRISYGMCYRCGKNPILLGHEEESSARCVAQKSRVVCPFPTIVSIIPPKSVPKCLLYMAENVNAVASPIGMFLISTIRTSTESKNGTPGVLITVSTNPF